MSQIRAEDIYRVGSEQELNLKSTKLQLYSLYSTYRRMPTNSQLRIQKVLLVSQRFQEEKTYINTK